VARERSTAYPVSTTGRSCIMKNFGKNILFASVLAMTAGSMAVAQSGNNWSEQWYRAKYGRPSPTEVARVQAAEANTAYREKSAVQAVAPQNTWFEAWYRAKYGRPAPTEEARIQAEAENTAYRQETPVRVTKPRNTWFEAWYRAKYGRPAPTEEMR